MWKKIKNWLSQDPVIESKFIDWVSKHKWKIYIWNNVIGVLIILIDWKFIEGVYRTPFQWSTAFICFGITMFLLWVLKTDNEQDE